MATTVSATTNRREAQRSAKRAKWMRKTLEGWMFIGPVVFGTLLFNVLPMIPTFYASFTFWTGLGEPRWTGLENYRTALFYDPTFRVSLKNTLMYMLGAVPGAMIAGLALALLVNERLKGIVLIRAIFFLPVITSIVAVGIVWRWIFNWQFGLINSWLYAFGIIGPRWLAQPGTAMFAVIVVAIWASMGYNMVLFLAGLQGVPPVLEEAATIDGANAWARFLYIKLPLLTPTIFFVLIISVISSFQVFGLIFTMTGGGPGTSTYVYVYHLWYQGFFEKKFGYGSALAWILFVVIAAVTWFQWKVSKRWVHYS